MFDYAPIATFVAVIGAAGAVIVSNSRQAANVSAQITAADRNAQARADAMVAAARETIDQAAITASAAITQSAITAQRAVDQVAQHASSSAIAAMQSAADSAALAINAAAIDARKLVTDSQEHVIELFAAHAADDKRNFDEVRQLLGALVTTPPEKRGKTS